MKSKSRQSFHTGTMNMHPIEEDEWVSIQRFNVEEARRKENEQREKEAERKRLIKMQLDRQVRSKAVAPTLTWKALSAVCSRLRTSLIALSRLEMKLSLLVGVIQRFPASSYYSFVRI
jgi:hypothetical protein